MTLPVSGKSVLGPPQRQEWFYTLDGDGYPTMEQAIDALAFHHQRRPTTSVQRVVQFVYPWQEEAS